ncbi:hypothetical protein [Kitasatospora sp. NPDC059160]|uniref:hypothetical protein n=1 Tax=unclassified Kitasatospora TaxID=2633591 RepID=UPI0036BC1205
MLHALERAWGGDPSQLGTAIGLMGQLRDTAQQIVDVELPADPRFTYGPEWLLV